MIIDNHDFEILVCLLKHRADGGFNIVFIIISRDDNGDFRPLPVFVLARAHRHFGDDSDFPWRFAIATARFCYTCRQPDADDRRFGQCGWQIRHNRKL